MITELFEHFDVVLYSYLFPSASLFRPSNIIWSISYRSRLPFSFTRMRLCFCVRSGISTSCVCLSIDDAQYGGGGERLVVGGGLRTTLRSKRTCVDV